VLFQFPPKVTSDSRSGTWTETELPGDQPFSAWKTSGARKITLEWTYIIGATQAWDTEFVRKQILALRAYYTAQEEYAGTYIVMLYLWKLGGPKPMSCRLGSIDITHGKALYVPDGNLKLAHPVITNVKVGIQLWSKGNAYRTFTSGNLLTIDKKFDVKGLVDPIPPEWQ